jgi:thiol-disulfide isomerase/thioredoxin
MSSLSRKKTLRRKRTKKPRRTLRRTPKKSGGAVAKKPIVILGKIYSTHCGHCIAMAKDWETMKQQLMTSKTANYEIWEIESKEEDAKKSAFLQQHGVALASSGYPTIFMIVQGKQVDYNGKRDAASLEQWATTKTI